MVAQMQHLCNNTYINNCYGRSGYLELSGQRQILSGSWIIGGTTWILISFLATDCTKSQ